MLITNDNYCKLYYYTLPTVTYQIPAELVNRSFKLSVRRVPDWTTQSMCDSVGTVDSGSLVVKFDLNTATPVFAEVCNQSKTAWLEIYADTASAREVFLQRKIYIGSRAGTIIGDSPDKHVISVMVMPAATARYYHETAIYAGETDLNYTKGHLYLGEFITATETFYWQDITPAGGGGSGDYDLLANRPWINGNLLTGNKSSADLGLQGAITPTNKIPSSNISGLANVATSGSYSDLSNTPTIPTALADLAEDSTHQTVTATQKTSWNSKADLENGKVPASQLPSYVDDVLEFSSISAFPAIGESGKIYVALDTNKTYRWGGTEYVEISSSLALGETADTAFPGNRGKATEDGLSSHVASTNNPHSVTAAQVGLGNVDNTSDANKPISTAMQTALNTKITEPSGRAANKVLGTDAQNNLVWKDGGGSGGQNIESVTASEGIATIIPSEGKIFTYTAAASDIVRIITTALTSAKAVTFELWITQPLTAVSFTLPSNVTWGDGAEFSSSQPAPVLSTGNMTYCIVFRWNGTKLIGNLAYTEA